MSQLGISLYLLLFFAGKPQRDRRKLREKRRSSGVVHLASTESTGGSTTGDDEGSSGAYIAHPEDRLPSTQHQPFCHSAPTSSYSGGAPSNLTSYYVPSSSSNMPADMRRKTQDNDCIPSSYFQAQDKLSQGGAIPPGQLETVFSDNHLSTHSSVGDFANNGMASTISARAGECSNSNPSFYGESIKGNASLDSVSSCSFPVSGNSHGLRGVSNCRRDKSPSDLEADDENDHDSLNQSETGSGSNASVCNVGLPSSGKGVVNLGVAASSSGLVASSERQGQPSPNYRGVSGSTSGTINALSGDVLNLSYIVEENKRLLSLMEEKDRRIHLLEYKVQQLMRDTLTISEEQSRLQKENSTLLRALSKLTMSKDKNKS